MREWHQLDVEHYDSTQDVYMDEKFHYKAVDSGNIVGVIKGTYELGVIYISSIMIAEDQRGKNIGEALLGKVENEGRKIGCHKTYLFTGDDWKANGFYASQGYRKTGYLKNHYLHKDFVIYEKWF